MSWAADRSAEGAALAWRHSKPCPRLAEALTLATDAPGVLKTLASALDGVVRWFDEFDAATLFPDPIGPEGHPGPFLRARHRAAAGRGQRGAGRAEEQVPERERALDALLHEVERRDQAVRAREADVRAREEETYVAARTARSAGTIGGGAGEDPPPK